MSEKVLGQKKVLVAMSGGVDSSVAAHLLKQAGFDVTGVYMCLGSAGDPDSDTRGCCSPQDAADARMVAQRLGIPLYVLNLADQFGSIIEYFIDEYRQGRPPNPCIHCNKRIKFGKLLDYATSLGIDYVATGHYARMVDVDGGRLIARKVKRLKDQSYVLFGIDRAALGRILFPLGEIETKDRVREIAREIGLKVHNKPDSQEVCFVPDNDYVGFLKKRAPATFRPGKIVDASGKVLARHAGIQGFTIGQRKGLGIQATGSNTEPLFVTDVDPATGRVRVGGRGDLLRTRLRATGANWHKEMPSEFDATVQIRYSHIGVPARVFLRGASEFEVEFREPVASITPGQAAVCYDGDLLLGGGWIERE